MAGFSLRKLFKQSKLVTTTTTTTTTTTPPPSYLPTDPHSLALSRSLTSLHTTRTKKRRGLHAQTPTLPPNSSSTSSLSLPSTLRLYSSVELRSPRAINYCLRTLKRSPRLANKVTRLTLDGWEQGTKRRDPRHSRRTVTGRLSHFLETCPRLVQLEIKGAIIFSLTDFANAENLHSLTLTHTLLSDRTTTSRYHPFFTTLPSLSSLSLLQASFDAPTAAHFLCPTTMPRLKVLNIEGVRLVDDPTTQRDLGGYEPGLVGGQLEYLRIGEGRSDAELGQNGRGGGRAPSEFVDKCSGLVGLSLPVNGVTETVLESLPPPLQHLEIRSSSSSLEVTSHLSAALALSTTFLALSSSTSTNSAPHSGVATPISPLSRSPSSSHLLSTSPGFASLFGTPRHSSGNNNEPVALEGLVSLTLPEEWGDWEGGASSSSGNLVALSASSSSAQARARGLSLSSSLATLSQTQAQARARGNSLPGLGGRWGSNAQGGGGEMAWALGRIARVAGAREIEVTFGVGVGAGVGVGGRAGGGAKEGGGMKAREVGEEWEEVKRVMREGVEGRW
ncbi:hypothetical protein BCR35DRAFT_309712 [Leucosporidium creatinivorum]|uniref:Uncharacterized protein n=1 Tax=Leucosporidium creatinivorum TaxID=106004 RepID=A0A1Y2DEN8_9BASI|nr:hypothetical protein BCR35DRAFT_309712 [Leucosporidium creatinivorum]